MNDLSFTEKLAAIGILISDKDFTQKKDSYVDIELTLAEAFITIHHLKDRLRILTLLMTWVEVHGWCVIQEKLKKHLYKLPRNDLMSSYAALIGAYAGSLKLKSWDHLLIYAPKPDSEILEISIPSAIELRGEDDWAKKSNFQLATGSLKTNTKWVLSRSQLAKTSIQYKNRLILGANWRADVLTAVHYGATRAADVQKILPISKEPANRIIKDLRDAGLVKTFGL